MPTDQNPTPVQLDPRGHYVTPAVVVLQGVSIATAEEPAKFHFLLKGGASLDLPVEAGAVEEIRVALEQNYPEHADFLPIS